MKNLSMQTALAALSLSLFAVQLTEAAKPGGVGGKPLPAPDIVYMSDDDSTAALAQAAVRGIVFDGNVGDVSLQKSKAGRQYQAVARSPDGNLVAWFEIGKGMVSPPGSIMVAATGSRPASVYTSVAGDGKPQPYMSTDSLAWGRDCEDDTKSILVFSGYWPVPPGTPEIHWGIFGIRFVGNSPQGGDPVSLWQLDLVLDENDNQIRHPPAAFAFSPAGEYLAFAGTTGTSSGVSVLPICPSGAPVEVVSENEILSGDKKGSDVYYTDWSPNSERLALSVTTGTKQDDGTYGTADGIPWRDLWIISLDCCDAQGLISGATSVRNVDLSQVFTEASSEHSPQWGPTRTGDEAQCERIAFSESSDHLGRGMYLLDVDEGGNPSCLYNAPQQVDAKWPRALDWKQ